MHLAAVATDGQRGDILRALGRTQRRARPILLLLETLRLAGRVVPAAVLCGELERLADAGEVEITRRPDARRAIATVRLTGRGWSPGDATGRTAAAAAAMAEGEQCRCGGTGWRVLYGTRPRVCECVCRAVFRICWERYLRVRASGRCGRVVSEVIAGVGLVRSMPGAEYMADCDVLARRALASFPRELAVYTGWRHGTRGGAALTNGEHWRAERRAQELVGRAYLDHGLLPREYFARRAVQAQSYQCDVGTWQPKARGGGSLKRLNGYCAGEAGEAMRV